MKEGVMEPAGAPSASPCLPAAAAPGSSPSMSSGVKGKVGLASMACRYATDVLQGRRQYELGDAQLRVIFAARYHASIMMRTPGYRVLEFKPSLADTSRRM